MARHILLCGMLIAIAGAAPTLAADAGEQAKLRDALMQLEKNSWEMVKKKDVAGFRNYFADEAVLIFSDGSRFSKEQFLQIVPDFQLDRYAIEGTGDIVVLAPDAATLIYRITYTSALKGGAAKKATVLSSSSYVRRGGQWLSVLYQETPTK